MKKIINVVLMLFSNGVNVDKDKYIYNGDLKYPLRIIAISMAIFIMFIAGGNQR